MSVIFLVLRKFMHALFDRVNITIMSEDQKAAVYQKAFDILNEETEKISIIFSCKL